MVTKPITAGRPAVPTLTINGIAPYGGIDATVYTEAPPSYNWYVDGALARTTTSTNTNAELIPAGSCDVAHRLSVRVTNACGTTSSADYTYSYKCSGGMMVYEVSPNPATNEIMVAPADESAANSIQSKAASGITEVNIYDQQGMLKKHQKFGGQKTARVNVSNLRTGVYFIEIVAGSYKERQQLSILK